jgi:hypothetical protein
MNSDHGKLPYRIRAVFPQDQMLDPVVWRYLTYEEALAGLAQRSEERDSMQGNIRLYLYRMGHDGGWRLIDAA